jgi:hypothetical protein
MNDYNSSAYYVPVPALVVYSVRVILSDSSGFWKEYINLLKTNQG